jgi:hypothetical protein
MKKLSITLFALATALATAPAGLADTFTFNYTGPVTNGPTGTVTLNGVFTTSTPYGPDGGVIMTSFTGTYADSGDGVSGAVSLYGGYGSFENYLTSSDGSWNFDNLFYPTANAPNTTGGQFDLQGPLFYAGPSSNPTEWEVNFWADSGTTYKLEESLTGSGLAYLSSSTGIGNYLSDNPGDPGDPPGPIITPAPEPSSLLLLGSGLLGLAVVALRKAKASGSVTRM